MPAWLPWINLLFLALFWALSFWKLIRDWRRGPAAAVPSILPKERKPRPTRGYECPSCHAADEFETALWSQRPRDCPWDCLHCGQHLDTQMKHPVIHGLLKLIFFGLFCMVGWMKVLPIWIAFLGPLASMIIIDTLTSSFKIVVVVVKRSRDFLEEEMKSTGPL